MDAPFIFMINSSETLNKFDYYIEEKNANKFSAVVTWSYTLLFLCTIIWILIIFTEYKSQKKKR